MYAAAVTSHLLFESVYRICGAVSFGKSPMTAALTRVCGAEDFVFVSPRCSTHCTERQEKINQGRSHVVQTKLERYV